MKLRKRMEFAAFVAPLLIFYGTFFIVPLGLGTMYAFTDWNGLHPEFNFVGVANFTKMLRDDRFLHTLRFTFSYTFLYCALVNVLGMALALFFNRKLRGTGLYRSMVFLPNVLNLVTIGFVWQFILGRLVKAAYDGTGWAVFEISFLGDPDWVLFSVVLVRLWQSAGYFMVIYLAGLQAISKSIEDAATVDGAIGWTRFRSVTLPLLMPAVTASVFISLINGLRIFPILMTLTEGGPGYASESISLNIYATAFRMNQFGYGSAKAVVFTVFILAVSAIQLFVFKRREVSL